MNRLGLSHADFLRLLSQNAGNVSIDIEQEFRKLAQNIARDREFADHFVRAPAEQFAEELPPALRKDLDDFLKRYGCRSRHRTLYLERWAESPQEVVGMLQSLVRTRLATDGGYAHPAVPAAPPGSRLPALPETEVRPMAAAGDFTATALAGRPFSRLALRVTARITRWFLDLREDLRFTMDRVLYLLRRALLALGAETGLGDKIMFLDDDELQAIVRGKLPQKQAAQRAALRYNQFRQPFDPPTFYNDGLAENEFQAGGTRISGIGTSPGRATGRAKIIDDPARAAINKGDILIAKNTDPGWTPILSIAGGMIMEEGGLLNHCAIVARELGVPAIVGVPAATRRIQNNDLITMDGGLGVIRIED